jgi:hypothetical protein
MIRNAQHSSFTIWLVTALKEMAAIVPPKMATSRGKSLKNQMYI